jgi:glucose uptake protein
MFTFMDALITVLAWGTWIGLAQGAGPMPIARRTFYVAVGNLIFALLAASLVTSGQPTQPFLSTWWLPFAGGVIWAIGNICAFAGVGGLGIARAAGIWTSLNILTALAWGALVFDEFAMAGRNIVVRLTIALVAVLAGLLIIIFARGDGEVAVAAGTSHRGRAVLASLAAGVLWGSYFVPAQASGLSPRLANVPLAAGMLAGALAMTLVTDHATFRLAGPRAYAFLLVAGVLWGIGNLGMLVLVERIGAGKGFTIAQLGLIVNALVGIFIFGNPRPHSRAATITLGGVVLAAIGGVLVGQSR